MMTYTPFLGQVRLRGSVRRMGDPFARRIHLPSSLGAPLPEFYGRFEIRDVDGNYIKDAIVSLDTADGRHLLSKLSDTGGNVSVTPQELQDAATAAGISLTKILYTVTAPGKAKDTGVFLDPNQPPKPEMHEITLKNQSPIIQYLPEIAVAGLIGAGIGWLVLRG